MRNLDFAMQIVSEGVADMEDRGFKVVPANAREAVAYVFGATEAVGSPDKIINSTAKVKQITKRVEEILSKGRMKKNPSRPRVKTQEMVLRAQRMMEPYWTNYGGMVSTRSLEKATNYVAERFVKSGMEPDEAEDDRKWRTETERGIHKILGIKQNPVHPRRGESEREFVSRCMSEEKMKFPKQKQRIAVCLSKARRNPFPDRNADE